MDALRKRPVLVVEDLVREGESFEPSPATEGVRGGGEVTSPLERPMEPIFEEGTTLAGWRGYTKMMLDVRVQIICPIQTRLLLCHRAVRLAVAKR